MKLSPLYKSIGEYKSYATCRFCFSELPSTVIDLGDVPLAGGFIKSKKLFTGEKFYPLELSFCENCFLLQSTNVIDKDILFKNYFYHSSAIKTLTDHFATTAAELINKKKNIFAVEIGCNDGTFIHALLQNKARALGIDPASNVVTPLIKKGVPIIDAYFTNNLAIKIVKKHGKVDLIFSSNVLAHIEDMHDIVKGIKTLLKPTGKLVFEVHYLGNVLKQMQYDMIYHEHQYYYSLMTLKKFFAMYDMEIYDVKPISIHAGSMRYYVQHEKTGKNSISKNVTKLFTEEKKLKFDKVETYLFYAKKIKKTKNDLLTLILKLKKENKTIAGYGASGRGTILMNYCGLNDQILDYVIDDAPAKQDAYTPGTHLKIVASDVLRSKNRPDFVILFAWSFFKEIATKNKNYLGKGGKFIVPLPKVEMISHYE
jgi:methylation protein EvaC